MTRARANLLLLLAAAIWGAGFVAQSTAMATIGPFWFSSLRFGIGTLCVLPFAILESRRAPEPLRRRHLLSFLAIGAVLFVAAILQQLGLMRTSVTNASFLTGLYVVFVPVIAVVFLRRLPHWSIWPGVLMAASGIFLLSGGALSTLTGGDGLMIVGAVFWSVQVTLISLFVTESGRPLMLSAVQFAVAAAGCIVAGLLFEPISIAAITGAWAEILYVGVVSCGLAFALQVIGQRYTTASQAAIFLSSEALFGALFGAIYLGESIGTIGYAGCAIIFAAILFVELVPHVARRTAAHKALSPSSEIDMP